MKRLLGRRVAGRLFLTLMLFAALAVSPRAIRAQEAENQEVTHAKDIRVNLFDACFADAQTGWVVGDLGRIFLTKDGGETWERQSVGDRRPILGITCLDATHAWVSSTLGSAFVTSDRGKTWTEQKTPIDRNLLDIGFGSPSRGTAVGDFGALVHTEDGGKTWTEVGLPENLELAPTAVDMGVDPRDVLLYGVTYADENNAWISGEFGTILASTDGGKTWTQQKSGVESTLFGIHFLDAKTGMAVGIDSSILRTEDGGATWTAIPGPYEEHSYYDVELGPDSSWIVGSRGSLLVSKDQGKTWKDFPTPIQFASEWFRGVSLASDTGYLVGGAGLVYKSTGEQATLLGGSTAEKRVVEHGG